VPPMGLDWIGGIKYPIVALPDALFLPPFYKNAPNSFLENPIRDYAL